MRFLVVSCVYSPEPVVSARTSRDIAETLAERGHDVTVLAPFPNRPGGRVYPGFSRRPFRRTRVGPRLTVVHCFSFLSRRSGFLSRSLEAASFGLTGSLAMFFVRRPDAVYSNTWPLLGSGALALVAHLRRLPLVLSVQDVYPESLEVQGRIRTGGPVANALRRLDGRIALSARAVVVISSRLAALYQATRGVPASALHVVANWGDGALQGDDAEGARWRASLGIPNDVFLLVYGGNIASAAGVETVIEAVGRLGADRKVWLVVAGDGPSLEACRRLAGEQPGPRILFRSPWPAEETASTLGAADALVLPTRGNQSLVSMPSKLVGYLLAGRPVIALAREGSDLAEMVESSDAGCVVPPDRPEELAAAIREVSSLSAADRQRRGAAGRAFALAHLSRDGCLPRLVALLEKTAGSPGESA
jgi:glycosyltransferase involved in cell wall biosynthesis